MALEIGGGITLGGGISLTVESGGGGGGGTTFSDTNGDFASWILGDGDGTGYLRFQGPFNPNDFTNGDVSSAFYNFTGNLTAGDSFSVVAVVSGTTYNMTATVDHVQVHQTNQVDLYYNTVSGDLPFSYGGDSLSITFAASSGGGGGGGTSYAPQYTSDPGGSPYPTTADYAFVTFHDMFGLTVKRMKSTSALYTFLSTAGAGDSFKVTFSGTVYTVTLGDFSPGSSVYADNVGGQPDFYTADISTFAATISPSLSAGEGATLYGTLISDLTG